MRPFQCPRGIESANSSRRYPCLPFPTAESPILLMPRYWPFNLLDDEPVKHHRRIHAPPSPTPCPLTLPPQKKKVMQGSDDPAASTEAHQAAFCHYQEQGQRSSSSSAASSPSSSPRVSTYADHKGFDNPAMRRAQGSTASTSAEAALKPSRYSEPATAVPDTYEGWFLLFILLQVWCGTSRTHYLLT